MTEQPTKQQKNKKTKQQTIVSTSLYHSPCGNLLLGSIEGKICLCDWVCSELHHRQVIRRITRRLKAAVRDEASETTAEAAKQLDEYFKGQRQQFTLPLVTAGTPFQTEVWNALQSLPYGVTTSYLNLAQSVGHAKAVRAVSRAVGANALSILIPCHRIVGSDNSLTGYAGGLAAKQFLLQLERIKTAP